MADMFQANIGMDDVLRQNAALKKQPTQVAFDSRNYLDLKLAPGEREKTVTVRLLPFSPEGGTSFHMVHTHFVKVNKEVAQSGWKNMVCPTKNGINKPCPYCEVAAEAHKKKLEETDPIKREALDKIEFANRPTTMWVVRVIDRAHEEDGPKFFMFKHKKSDGLYDKIINLIQRRAEKARAKGEDYFILNLVDGKDLEITIRKNDQGKTTYEVVDSEDRTPLSENVELANKWINDTKKWEDLYPIKPYDYLSIVLNMQVPYYNKEQGKFVPKLSKEEYDEMVDKQIQEELTPVPTAFESIQQSSNSSTEEDELPF